MLLYKAMINGLGGQMYNAKNVYTGSYSAVNLNGHVTDWFECNQGVRQGDTLSPTLFGLYVNDLVEALNNTNSGISIGDLQLSCLLYADDLVLLGNP